MSDYDTLSEAELNEEVANRRGLRMMALTGNAPDYCGSVIYTSILSDMLVKAGHPRQSISTREKKRAVVVAWLTWDDGKKGEV